MRGFPIIGRYTIVGTSYSIARAIGAVLTSYTSVWLASKYGFTGMAVLMFIVVLLNILGLHFFTPCKEDQDIEKDWKNRSQQVL